MSILNRLNIRWRLVAMIAMILVIAILLPMIVFAVAMVINPNIWYNFGAPIAFIGILYLNEIIINLKYNEQWIYEHSRDEIIDRYGEFDVYVRNTGYYFTEKISNVSYNAIEIVFDQDGTVKDVDMDGHYGYPGG